jgi:CRP-like cAMP-binding protein
MGEQRMPERVTWEEISARLETCPPWADLSPAAREGIARHGQARHHAPGDVFIGPGDEARSLYVVVRGRVRISQPWLGSREPQVRELGPGECLWDLRFLGDDEFPGKAEAVQESVLFELRRNTFEALLRRQPEIGVELVRALAGRLSGAAEAAEELGLREVRRHVYSFLWQLYTVQGESFQLPVGIDELGDVPGAPSGAVRRILTDLVASESITLDGQAVRVLKPDVLRQGTL